jgi:hypothetical protein
MDVPMLGMPVWCHRELAGRVWRLTVETVTHKPVAVVVKGPTWFGWDRMLPIKALGVRPDHSLSLRLSRAQFDRLPRYDRATSDHTTLMRPLPIIVPMGGVIWPSFAPLFDSKINRLPARNNHHVWVFDHHAPVFAVGQEWGTLSQAYVSMNSKRLSSLIITHKGFNPVSLEIPPSWIIDAKPAGISLKLDATQVDKAARFLQATPASTSATNKSYSTFNFIT